MRSTTAVRFSVLLAVLAIPADALGAATVRTSSVTGRLVVPTGRPSTISLHCQPGAVALNAAIARRGAGVVVRASIPGRAAGAWSFRVAAGGSGSRAVSAVLRCVRLAVPAGLSGIRLQVRTRHRVVVPIAPGATTSTSVGCGSRWTATGYALRGDRNGDVRLAGVVPGAHGWSFTLENTGSSAVPADVGVRCVKSTVAARRSAGGSAELRFGVGRRSFTTPLAAGRGAISRRGCGAGRFSVAAGARVDEASPVELLTASPARQRRSRWTFANATAGDLFTGYSVCLNTASRFH